MHLHVGSVPAAAPPVALSPVPVSAFPWTGVFHGQNSAATRPQLPTISHVHVLECRAARLSIRTLDTSHITPKVTHQITKLEGLAGYLCAQELPDSQSPSVPSLARSPACKPYNSDSIHWARTATTARLLDGWAAEFSSFGTTRAAYGEGRLACQDRHQDLPARCPPAPSPMKGGVCKPGLLFSRLSQERMVAVAIVITGYGIP
ncbi:hypothetical protein B0T24DRAFT_66826 [Lasiosphaeria ovina]|uniref:Uncharacterized protein n=1 Tax=Lasiosphaeria ovina TaxID=92902 RepID=A0AAE0NLS1_9PEZI|nr:hypothetical protein B0T24DRAFT_66826 [Lasiosphaeria ovina]